MSKWLTIAGIGEDGFAGLGARARQALASARHVVGSDRTLAMLPPSSALHHHWPQPFAAVVEQLQTLRGEPTVMLATGDPMNFGVARKILTFIAKDEIDILPGAFRLCPCGFTHGLVHPRL